MISLRPFLLAAAACPALLAVGACSRTSDGTVVMKPPTIALPAPSWAPWKKTAPQNPAYAEIAPAPAQSAIVQAAPPKQAYKPKPLFRSPLMTLDGKGDLKCEDVKQPNSGRVSVVCK